MPTESNKAVAHHRNGIVDLGVGEQVGPHGLLLDLLGQHRANLVGLVKQIPNLQFNFKRT